MGGVRRKRNAPNGEPDGAFKAAAIKGRRQTAACTDYISFL
jgi:hypothetical protein